jgi:hypothetical protein
MEGETGRDRDRIVNLSDGFFAIAKTQWCHDTGLGAPGGFERRTNLNGTNRHGSRVADRRSL